METAKRTLVQLCTLPPSHRQEALDICCGAVELFPAEMERCCQTIKESLDKRFGGPWHVVTGQSFAFEVTHAAQHVLFVYLGVAGRGVLIWKR